MFCEGFEPGCLFMREPALRLFALEMNGHLVSELHEEANEILNICDFILHFLEKRGEILVLVVNGGVGQRVDPADQHFLVLLQHGIDDGPEGTFLNNVGGSEDGVGVGVDFLDDGVLEEAVVADANYIYFG